MLFKNWLYVNLAEFYFEYVIHKMFEKRLECFFSNGNEYFNFEIFIVWL
jgi:hypothetical protein